MNDIQFSRCAKTVERDFYREQNEYNLASPNIHWTRDYGLAEKTTKIFCPSALATEGQFLLICS